MVPPRAGLTPRAKVLLPLFMVVLVALSYFRLRPAPSASQFEGETMGTTYSVVLGESSQTKDSAGLALALQGELDRVEALMSTYQEQSELSRFNRQTSTDPFPVSIDTAAVVQAAQAISRQTDGAFDVTVGPLVALWGFGAGAQATAPTEAEIQRERRRVGFENLSSQSTPPTLRKATPDLRCDLSAIAKGYAVDQLARLLEERGANDYLVEVGGELRIRGAKANGRPWRVGIERPDSEGRTVATALEVTDIGMATSGDYRSYYEKDGVRISHTIDPRSGRPITHRLASVSVLHPEAMLADGYATALNVLGPEHGAALAEKLNLAVQFIIREPDGTFSTRSTPAFERRTKSSQVQDR